MKQPKLGKQQSLISSINVNYHFILILNQEYNNLKEMAQNMKKDNNIVHIDRLIMLIIANSFNIGM
jgi:hypothetical protein